MKTFKRKFKIKSYFFRLQEIYTHAEIKIDFVLDFLMANYGIFIQTNLLSFGGCGVGWV